MKLSRRKLLGGIAALPLLSNRVEAAVLRGVSSGLGPIVASPSGRYFVNQATGKPWFMLADSGQAMAIQSPSDVDFYLSVRAAQGFNAIQFDLILPGALGNPDTTNYSTLDGIAPFTGAKITTPNPTYFARMDRFVQECRNNNLVAILNPFATDGSGQAIGDMAAAGNSACYAFGQYVARRYTQAHVMWQFGNDYNNTGNTTDDAAMLNMMQGVASIALNQLRAIELNYNPKSPYISSSTGRDNATLNPVVTLTGAYADGLPYGTFMAAYNPPRTSFGGRSGTNAASAPFFPSIYLEGWYASGNGKRIGLDNGTPLTIRREMYWALLCGQTGVIYGNALVWSFANTSIIGGSERATGYVNATPYWKNNLASPDIPSVQVWYNFLNSIPWYNLVPDQAHAIGISGYGTENDGTGYPMSLGTYVTLGATADAHYAIAYFSLGLASTLTVALSGFAGTVTAQWFDPTNGAYTSIGTFPNSDSHDFTPRGKNNAGDPDWVLLLTV